MLEIHRSLAHRILAVVAHFSPECRLAELYHASASLPKDSDNGFRRWSGFELRGDLSGDLGAPLLHRLKTRELATMRLGLAVKLILRLVQVDFEAAGLRDVPRRVAKHLDAIAFGIVEIDRPGIAMADRSEALAAGRAHLAESALHTGERADIERDLLHHRRLEFGLASRHEHHLVVVAGVTAQEGDASVGCGIADHKAENAGVEVDHPRQVGHINPDMAQTR